LPSGQTIFIADSRIEVAGEPVLRLIALGASLVLAAASGAAMMSEWPTSRFFGMHREPRDFVWTRFSAASRCELLSVTLTACKSSSDGCVR